MTQFYTILPSLLTLHSFLTHPDILTQPSHCEALSTDRVHMCQQIRNFSESNIFHIFLHCITSFRLIISLFDNCFPMFYLHFSMISTPKSLLWVESCYLLEESNPLLQRFISHTFVKHCTPLNFLSMPTTLIL